MAVIEIIGAGLAGCEAAWQAANRGMDVILREMRPGKMTPAHHSGYFAELVCSNSLRGIALENAVGLLKEEMRRQNSLVMQAAEIHQVPAGGALAVDRVGFSRYITEKLKQHPRVRVIEEEVDAIPERGISIIATGPLTSENLSQAILDFTGEEYLYFYDAAAPIVTRESLDFSKIFPASRYGKGQGDEYLNCPFDKEQYQRFWQELVRAETAPIKEFEKQIFFEGCMPVEVLAKRGEQTLLFGPMKPVGLNDPRTGKQPYAVVQLRQDNAEGTLYNLVGFQTHLKWGEQERVFRLIPGLEQAEFVRYGVMHRNTYINSPRILLPTLQTRKRPNLFFAGQITGVEGYVESAAAGLVAGINAARLAQGQEPLVWPETTAHGSLLHYITTANPETFQPMNVTFGLFPPLPNRIKNKKERNLELAARALRDLEQFQQQLG